MKKSKNKLSTEYTDEQGQKWIQTSTEDLFSVKELNEIIDSLEQEKESGEIVLAHIDFKKVNKEYYDSVNELQTQLKKREDQLKKIVSHTKEIIDRKNTKLNELIKYIKKLHMLLAYYKLDKKNIDKVDIFKYKPVISGETEEDEEITYEYIDADEIELDDEGNETGDKA